MQHLHNNFMRKTTAILANFRKIILLGIAIISLTTIIFLVSKQNSTEAAEIQTITDQNADGRINLIDARILSPPETTSCPVCVDVNGDKTINQTDVDLVQRYADQTAMVTATELPKPKYKSRYDVNNDKVVNLSDVAIIKNYLGQTVGDPAFGLDNPSELTFGFMANDILIKFKPEATDLQKQSVFAKYDLNPKRTFQTINTTNLTAKDSNVEQMQKQILKESVVQSAQKSYIFELLTDDPHWAEQWGHQRIRIPETWFAERTTGRTPNKVRVAIIDTGADYNHYDLGANLSQTLRRNVQIDPVWPFEQQDVTDEAGHGTFMAGIIGATTNNNSGVAGLNWNVEIIPIKAAFINVYGEYEMPLPYLYVAMEWVFLNHSNIDVLNMSYGIPGVTSDPNIDYYLDALDYFGVILIAAAGNLGRNDSSYPANNPRVVSVASSGLDDNFCPNSSGRQSADILAPGDQIISTVPPDLDLDINHDGVEYAGCGTSQAAAYVSGVAALCKAVAPAYPLRSDLKCNKFRHNGYGRLDAWATIWYVNCKRFDNNSSGTVDVIDIAQVAFRSNSPQLYNVLYDVYPVGGDGKIDISDAYVQVSRSGIRCQ